MSSHGEVGERTYRCMMSWIVCVRTQVHCTYTTLFYCYRAYWTSTAPVSRRGE